MNVMMMWCCKHILQALIAAFEATGEQRASFVDS